MDVDFPKVEVEEKSMIEKIDADEQILALEAKIAELEAKSRSQRTGEFYQQEFPEYVARPLTAEEQVESTVKGMRRREKKAKRYANKNRSK